MSWDKLSHKELLETLENDFAFPLTDTEKSTKKKTLDAVAQGNLKFADYLAAHPEEREKYAPEAEEAPVTGEELAKQVQAPAVSEGAEYGVQVQTDPAGQAPWLIKMERANGHFEVGKYVFTREHPYVLVDVNDVKKVMQEGGFRQAYPEELQEFYG